MKAIECYSKAISLSEVPSYYSNRSLCYMQLEKYDKCIEDCNKTLELDPYFVKALRRRARCLIFCDLINNAIKDY